MGELIPKKKPLGKRLQKRKNTSEEQREIKKIIVDAVNGSPYHEFLEVFEVRKNILKILLVTNGDKKCIWTFNLKYIDSTKFSKDAVFARINQSIKKRL